MKALSFDKHSRMGPEELISFGNSHLKSAEEGYYQLPTNISEKKFNITIKYDTLVSESSTPKKFGTSKNASQTQLLANKSEKRILNPLKQNHTIEQNPIDLKKDESVSPNKTQRKKDTVKREDRKNISKVLIAEVHFCRFLFKLLARIKESVKKGILNEGSYG